MYKFRIKEVKRSEINTKVIRLTAHPDTAISKYFLATFKFQDVGIVHVSVHEPPGAVFIHYLYVLAEFRGMGFGGKLLDAVEQLARENGNVALELEPGQIDLTFPVSKVEAWYQQRGYQPTPENARRFKKYINQDGRMVSFMGANSPDSKGNQVSLQPVNQDNWRDVASLSVAENQRDFVADPCYYLALCSYGNVWQPLAICLDEQVVGFMMWAIDSADGSCWLGGILIDKTRQRHGYGRQAVQAAITMLREEHGHRNFALSYQPTNVAAKHLYSKLGFVETDEWEDGEIVARLSLEEA